VNGDELLLDMTSPLPTFDEHELRQWAMSKNIFISSTMRDLQEERQRAAVTIQSVGATPRFFERFSSPSGPQGIYVPEVARADAVVLLLGERYGGPYQLMTRGARRPTSSTTGLSRPTNPSSCTVMKVRSSSASPASAPSYPNLRLSTR
jgi:hypothetical protein